MSYFAELEKVSQKQRERIEHQRQARKEEAAKAVKKTRIYADSVEELGRKISQVDWDKVKETEQPYTGGRFDLTV